MSNNLHSILNILDNVPALNSGGCGIAALAIYRWSKKNGVDVDSHPFVILCEDEWELRHNNAACENGDLDDITIPHVVIEIGDDLYDSEGNNGKLQRELTYRQDYQLNEDELLGIINTDAWNDMFDREWVDYIAEELDVDLSDVVVF